MNVRAEEEMTHPGTPVQLRLFPPAKPLLERFGPDFFRNVPECPGVYLMSGDNHRLLYIGQSQNLRTRLNSYKNLNLERASRKLVRLVHLARSITWEICASPEQAQLRENELLRLHKPSLNVANTRPEHYAFIGMRRDESRLLLRLTKSPVAEPGEKLYGAFKGVWSVRAALAALLRFFWALERPSLLPHEMPSALVHGKTPEHSSVDLGNMEWKDMGERLELFLGGRTPELLDLFSDRLSKRQGASLFLLRLWEQDLECLRHFYRLGPQRALELRQQFQISEELIEPAELDDLLVLQRQNKALERNADLTAANFQDGHNG